MSVNLKGFSVLEYTSSDNQKFPKRLTTRQQKTFQYILRDLNIIQFGDHLPKQDWRDDNILPCWDEAGNLYELHWNSLSSPLRYKIFYVGDDYRRKLHPLHKYYNEGYQDGYQSWSEVEQRVEIAPDPDPSWTDEQKEVYYNGFNTAQINSMHDV